MGGIGSYDVVAQAIGEGTLKASERKVTEVVGIADVDLVVSESKRVLDVGGKTTFNIRLRNYGTKDATHLLVKAELSPKPQIRELGKCQPGSAWTKKPNGKRRRISGDRQAGPARK